MNDRVDFGYLLSDSRARVYLLWAAITGVGFTATHYYQNKNINAVWFTLSLIGFGYMWRVMPLRVRQMRNIFLSWLIPVGIGICVSALAADTSLLPEVLSHLGAFWLLVCAVGYLCNGLFDSPSAWYYVVAGVNGLAAVICYANDAFSVVQYLIAAIVSVWSMLLLVVFRADAL